MKFFGTSVVGCRPLSWTELGSWTQILKWSCCILCIMGLKIQCFYRIYPINVTVTYSIGPHGDVSSRTVPYITLPIVPYRTVPYRTVPYLNLKYSTVPCRTIPYSTLSYRIFQYRTVPYCTEPLKFNNVSSK